MSETKPGTTDVITDETSFSADEPGIRPIPKPGVIPRFWRWYEERARWHTLRAHGTSPVVRASILMPVVGYLILLNEHVVALARTAPEFSFLADFDPLRLVLFYAGTVLLAVASVVFATYCPPPCNKFDNAVEYALVEGAFFTANPHILRKMIEGKLRRRSQADGYVDRERIGREFAITMPPLAEPHSDRLEATFFLMDQFWHFLDPDQPVKRIVCRILYDLGFLLVGLPALWTAVGVARFVGHRYLGIG